MRNMKIKVENNLDEIVATLESKGYIKSETFIGIDSAIITTQKDGSFTDWSENCLTGLYETTLAEIKEQPNAAD